jgi:hypothetical protein
LIILERDGSQLPEQPDSPSRVARLFHRSGLSQLWNRARHTLAQTLAETRSRLSAKEQIHVELTINPCTPCKGEG